MCSQLGLFTRTMVVSPTVSRRGPTLWFSSDPMIVSDPDLVVEDGAALLSPPRNWPDSFKDELRQFIGKRGLKSRRCRLVARGSQLAPETAAQAAQLVLHPSDSRSNAELARQELGWDVIVGFAVFELADRAKTFVAHARCWNATSCGVWVDVTREAPASTEAGILLAEADQPAALQTDRGAALPQAVPRASAPSPANATLAAPSDEHGRIAAFLELLARIEAAEREAEREIRRRGWHWGTEATRLVTTFKLEALTTFAGVEQGAAIATNPLERVWEAVLTVLPRVFRTAYASRDEPSDAELDELRLLAEGRGQRSGPLLVRATDESEPLFLPGCGARIPNHRPCAHRDGCPRLAAGMPIAEIAPTAETVALELLAAIKLQPLPLQPRALRALPRPRPLAAQPHVRLRDAQRRGTQDARQVCPREPGGTLHSRELHVPRQLG